MAHLALVCPSVHSMDIQPMAFLMQQEHIRERLRLQGFKFCDDGFALAASESQDLGEKLQLQAVESSSCDHAAQVQGFASNASYVELRRTIVQREAEGPESTALANFLLNFSSSKTCTAVD